MIMKHIKYITLIVALFATMACTISDIDDVNVQTNDKGGAKISVYGQITRFDDCDVNTRANKTPEEAYVSKMALAVFPIVDGNIQNCISYGLKDGSNLLFTLDRSKMDKEEYANQRFALYIFTNMPALPESGYTGSLDDLLKLALENPGLTRPEHGFPMVGSLGDPNRDGKAFILMPMSGNRMELPTVDGAPTEYINIPMDAIFAKVSFSINVTADQDIASSAPSMFEMTGYKINNLPTAVYFNEELNKEETQSVRDSAVEVALSGIAKGSAESGGSIIEFDFYLPERYLDPDKAIDDVLPEELKKRTYGTDVDKDQNGYRDEDEKYHQRFKPLLLGDDQKPTYITIMGKFRDHQEETYTVEYDIYLGADNYSDFNLERNNQYINSMTIRGISSSNDQSLNGSAVAIDHRVTVTRSMPLIISFRRETLLDAHFEVRPLRVRPVGDDVPSNASVTVNVLNADGTENNRPGWVRIEASGNTAHHITEEGVSKGKRKYFTTDLVTNTLAGKTSVTVNNLTTGENQAVWVYVDENTSTASRSAVIQVSYTYDKNGVETTETQDFTIVQQGLYQLTQNGRTYTIENHEEYLYNYDAENTYGQTDEEGMTWGLYGKQLSHEHRALFFNAYIFNFATNWINNINGVTIYYDFYTTSHDTDDIVSKNAAKHDWTVDGVTVGQHFCSEIISQIDENRITNLTLDAKPQSAVEYCYNRNKRNAEGKVDKIEWYLPASNEMEDIIVGGFSRFEEFQDKYYWSSQPAYVRNYAYNERWVIITIPYHGTFYYDEIGNLNCDKGTEREGVGSARATKVYKLNGVNTPVYSNATGNYSALDCREDNPVPKVSGTFQESGTLGSQTRDDGHQPRSRMNRVRCAYKVIK